MPNWTHNSLNITGPKAELGRFMGECFSTSEGRLELDFNKIVPQPPEVIDSIAQPSARPAAAGSGDIIIGRGDYIVPNWYRWRCKHWGTKWNASYTTVKRTDDAVELYFDTAWAPPWPIYEQLVERFPLLKAEGTAVELQNGCFLNIAWRDGKISVEKDEESAAKWEKWMCEPPSDKPDDGKPKGHVEDYDVPF